MKNSPSIVPNRISDILKTRGFNEFTPTNALLSDLKVSRIYFFKIIKNKVEPSFGEAHRFAHWLDVSVNDLYKPGISKEKE